MPHRALTPCHGAICGGLGLAGREGIADIKRQLEVASVDEDSQAIVHGLRKRFVRLAARHEFWYRGELLLLLGCEALEDVEGRLLACVESLLQPFLLAVGLLRRWRSGFLLLCHGFHLGSFGRLVHLDLLPWRLRGWGRLARVDVDVFSIAPNRVPNRPRVDMGEFVRVLQSPKFA